MISPDPGRRVDTPFGFRTTAEEVLAGVDLSGRRALVTGGASGIGRETARALAAANATVTIADRDLAGAVRAAAEIAESTSSGSISARHLDLADRLAIEDFVSNWRDTLHILVNSAGVMAIPDLTLTAAGHEMQFAVNHLGHFALALGLHPALADAGDARVVAISSSAHLRSPVIFDDIHFSERRYDPFLAYGQSKTANVLFAVDASRRWAENGIAVNAVMPGGVATNLQRHVPHYLDQARAEPPDQSKLKTVEQAAATPALAAASPLLRGVTGRYLEDCNEASLVRDPPAIPTSGLAPYAVDEADARRLWRVSLEMLGRSAAAPGY